MYGKLCEKHLWNKSAILYTRLQLSLLIWAVECKIHLNLGVDSKYCIESLMQYQYNYSGKDNWFYSNVQFPFFFFKVNHLNCWFSHSIAHFWSVLYISSCSLLLWMHVGWGRVCVSDTIPHSVLRRPSFCGNNIWPCGGGHCGKHGGQERTVCKIGSERTKVTWFMYGALEARFHV